MQVELWIDAPATHRLLYAPANLEHYAHLSYEVPDEDWRYMMRFVREREERTEHGQTVYRFEWADIKEFFAGLEPINAD